MDVGGPENLEGASDQPDWTSDVLGAGRERGWLHPDDRLWRHPSETHGARSPVPASAKQHDLYRRPSVGAGIVGVTALSLVVIAGLSLIPNRGYVVTPGNLADVTATTTVEQSVSPAPMTRLASSLVALSATVGQTTLRATGVVFDGDRVLTSGFGSLQDLGVVRAQTDSGVDVVATLSGRDATTGIALYSIGIELGSASLVGSDADEPSAGSVQESICLCETSGTSPSSSSPITSDLASAQTSSPAPETSVFPFASGTPSGSGSYSGPGLAMELSPALIETEDSIVPSSGSGSLLDALSVSTDQVPDPYGNVLVNSSGDVTGILAGYSPSGDNGNVDANYVPAWLAADIATSLAGESSPGHGHLGVSALDVGAGQCGITLTWVDNDGPASAAGLVAGDRISSFDNLSICTVGQLEALLYATAPNSEIVLDVQEAGIEVPVPVVLASST